jgi:hypothetical protein
MMISEEMKTKYEVIGQKTSGGITVAYESRNTGMRVSYTSKEEFMRDIEKHSLKGVILENVNG